jgi:hypothetical protein
MSLEARSAYDQIEFTAPIASGSHFYLGGASSSSLASSVAVVVALSLLHLLITFKSPPLHATKHEFFNLTTADASRKIDITLKPLLPLHRWVYLSRSGVTGSHRPV